MSANRGSSEFCLFQSTFDSRIYTLHIKVSKDYPAVPPVMSFTTRVNCTCVDQKGRVRTPHPQHIPLSFFACFLCLISIMLDCSRMKYAAIIVVSCVFWDSKRSIGFLQAFYGSKRGFGSQVFYKPKVSNGFLGSQVIFESLLLGSMVWF